MSDIFVKYAGSGISTIFTQIRQQSDSHVEFLDPLCTILKLCVLNYKPIGTKISIRDNIIYIQESNIFQNILRTIYNDSREQLYHIKMPIFYFKGLECNFIDNKFSKELLTYIKTIAIIGLNKLKATYEMDWKNCSMIRSCINDYLRILKNNYSKEQYTEELNDMNKPLMLNIYDEMLNIWKNEDLDNIINIIKTINMKFTSNNNSIDLINIDDYSNSINALINAKDKEINSIRP